MRLNVEQGVILLHVIRGRFGKFILQVTVVSVRYGTGSHVRQDKREIESILR